MTQRLSKAQIKFQQIKMAERAEKEHQEFLVKTQQEFVNKCKIILNGKLELAVKVNPCVFGQVLQTAGIRFRDMHQVVEGLVNVAVEKGIDPVIARRIVLSRIK